MAIGHGPYGDGDAGFIVITSNDSAVMNQHKALHTQNVTRYKIKIYQSCRIAFYLLDDTIHK